MCIECIELWWFWHLFTRSAKEIRSLHLPVLMEINSLFPLSRGGCFFSQPSISTRSRNIVIHFLVYHYFSMANVLINNKNDNNKHFCHIFHDFSYDVSKFLCCSYLARCLFGVRGIIRPQTSKSYTLWFQIPVSLISDSLLLWEDCQQWLTNIS